VIRNQRPTDFRSYGLRNTKSLDTRCDAKSREPPRGRRTICFNASLTAISREVHDGGGAIGERGDESPTLMGEGRRPQRSEPPPPARRSVVPAVRAVRSSWWLGGLSRCVFVFVGRYATHRDGCNDLKGIFKRLHIRWGPENQGGFRRASTPLLRMGINCEHEIQAQQIRNISDNSS